MADISEVARRREMRRKRIIENSEERLNKLFGCNREHIEGTGGQTTDSNQTTPHSATTDGSTISPIVSEVEPSTPTSGDESGRLSLLVNLSSTQETASTITTTKPTYRRHSSKGSSCEPDVTSTNFEPTLNIPEIKKKPAIPKSPKAKGGSSTELVSARKLVCLVTAIFVRLVLCNQAMFAGKSIVYPFALLEALFVSYDFFTVKEKPDSPGGVSQLVIALVLSGIPSHTLDRLANIIATVTKVVEDTALYLFSFVVVHWFTETLQQQ